ncbi:hypothetical protein SLE2022_280400 [Rubroshorea leprosula]
MCFSLPQFLNTEDFDRTGISRLVTVGVRERDFPNDLVGLTDSVFWGPSQPWLPIPSAGKILKEDRILCPFSPCVEQVQPSCETLRSNFTKVRTFEVLLRSYEVREWRTDCSKAGGSVGFPPCKRRRRKKPSSEGSMCRTIQVLSKSWLGHLLRLEDTLAI